MATVTLAESAKLSQDQLVIGVAEEVITVDRFFQVLPFMGISGNALAYNRENVLGDADVFGVGDTITAKAAATFTQVTTSLTSIIGDAEVNGLIQATRSNFQDQRAQQVASKAKSVGRKYRDMLINGTGAGNQFEGLLSLVAGGQSIVQAVNGAALSFEKLDELLDLVTAKDGEVDYLIMSDTALRQYYRILRALGGAGIGEAMTLPSGEQVPMYRGVPIFRNQYVPENQTEGTCTTCTTVLAGTLDDGSRSTGVVGLTAEAAAGIAIKDIGESETKDETITRVVWYSSLALFTSKGLAALTGVDVTA